MGSFEILLAFRRDESNHPLSHPWEYYGPIPGIFSHSAESLTGLDPIMFMVRLSAFMDPIRIRHRGQNRRRTAQAYPAAQRRGQADHLQADRQDAHQQKIQRLFPEKCRCAINAKSPASPGFFNYLKFR